MKYTKEIVDKMIEEFEERIMILNGCIRTLKSQKMIEENIGEGLIRKAWLPKEGKLK